MMLIDICRHGEEALLRGSILPYYGYYKYGVIPWLDHGIQKKP
jgi:hypothetical protein